MTVMPLVKKLSENAVWYCKHKVSPTQAWYDQRALARAMGRPGLDGW